MYIPTHQMHNVLNVYARQLRQNNKVNNPSNKPQASNSAYDKVNISADGKRRSIIEKVAHDISKRISSFNAESESIDDEQKKIKEQVSLVNTKQSDFIFNTIDNNNQKKTTTFNIKNSASLFNQLDRNSSANDDNEI